MVNRDIWCDYENYQPTQTTQMDGCVVFNYGMGVALDFACDD